MIGKETRLFGLIGENLAASKLYQMYNYIFEANSVDAAFVNMSVPAGKFLFTLQNLGHSQFESLLVDKESAALPELLGFFGKNTGYISKIDLQDGALVPIFVSSVDDGEECLLQEARLNFFEWFGRYPDVPEDALNTLKESTPRDSILTRE